MAAGDLTSLDAVKAWLQTGQNAFPATDDALLSGLITAASQFIENWLNRGILTANYIEQRDGTGGQRFVFANFPVTAVLTLSIDGLTIPPVPAAGGFGAGYTFTTTELVLRGYGFARGAQNVAVTYTAGYDNLPADIAQACVELVGQRYRERTRIGEVAKTLAGSETARFSQAAMSEAVKAMLLPYRVAAPAGIARRLAPPL